MDTLTCIKTRRAIKHYDPDFKIPEKDMYTLLEHTILSPTSFNMQHWRIVVVDAQEQKNKLYEAAWKQDHVRDASATVLLCADLDAWKHEPARYWENAPEAVQNVLVPMIRPFYENNAQLQRDEALRSIGIAAQTFMLAATEMGYDTCPMIGYDPKIVADIIGLENERHLIGLMITIGKGTKPAWDRPGQLPLEEVVRFNRF